MLELWWRGPENAMWNMVAVGYEISWNHKIHAKPIISFLCSFCFLNSFLFKLGDWPFIVSQMKIANDFLLQLDSFESWVHLDGKKLVQRNLFWKFPWLFVESLNREQFCMNPRVLDSVFGFWNSAKSNLWDSPQNSPEIYPSIWNFFCWDVKMFIQVNGSKSLAKPSRFRSHEIEKLWEDF